MRFPSPSRHHASLLVLVPALVAACSGQGHIIDVGGIGGGFAEGGSFNSGFSGGIGGGGGSLPPPMDVCPQGGLKSGVCTPTVSQCNASTSLCASEVDQSTATAFGLRVAQITTTRPAALAQGILKTTIDGAALPAQPECNLPGQGTFSWLLRFDTKAGQLTTGGARPVASPAQPYQLVDEDVPTGDTSFHVAPVTLTSAISPSCAFESSPGDVVLPVYLDAAATQVLLLPLHQLRFHDGVVSADNGCIGAFNIDSFDSCTPGPTRQAFLDGASLDAFFDIEEADTVVVDLLGMSLCAALAGQGFGDGASPVAHCKRGASGNILFKGDWCSKTDAPATPGCADALRFSATFAANGVLIQ